MDDYKHLLVFRISEAIHIVAIIAIVWLLVVSYIEPGLILTLYRYLFNDISFRSLPTLIGMRSDAEIAYFLLSSHVIFILHLNMVFVYAANVNLREKWEKNKLSLPEVLNKNLWGCFWPHYPIRVFRLRNYHYENELKKAIIKLLRDETYIDLPGIVLIIVMLYPLLYSSVFESDFLSIFGWQLLTFIVLMVFWNQVLKMVVLLMSLIMEKGERLNSSADNVNQKSESVRER